jgi:hypothetical protein
MPAGIAVLSIINPQTLLAALAGSVLNGLERFQTTQPDLKQAVLISVISLISLHSRRCGFMLGGR